MARKLGAAEVIDVLADLFITRGVPAHVRSDNGPEFVAKAVRGWIGGVGARAPFIEPGGPWETDEVEKAFSASGAIFVLRAGDRVAKSGARRCKPRRAAYDGRSSLAAPVRTRPRLGFCAVQPR